MYNNQNHTYYKVYFDKPAKVAQKPAHTPLKTLDPYLENEIKDTRMPDYSVLSQ